MVNLLEKNTGMNESRKSKKNGEKSQSITYFLKVTYLSYYDVFLKDKKGGIMLFDPHLINAFTTMNQITI